MGDEVKFDDQEAKFGLTPDQVLRINDPYRYQGTPDAKLEIKATNGDVVKIEGPYNLGYSPDAKLEIKSTEGQEVEGLQLECSIEKIMPGLSFHDSDGQVICQISPEGEITGDIRDALTSLELGFNQLSPLWKIIKRLVQERDEARELLESAVRLLEGVSRWNLGWDEAYAEYGFHLNGKYAGLTAMDLVKLEAQRHARSSNSSTS
jgi:hypothetical protein